MDYYKELEIGKNSSPEQIRSAYKKLALKWHNFFPVALKSIKFFNFIAK